MAFWMMTFAALYMTLASPAGRPMAVMRPSSARSKRSSESCRRQAPGMRASVHTTSPAQISCDRLVAMAAPAVPRRKPATKSRSSAVLASAQTIRKYNGRFESPTARRMPAPML